MKARLTFLAQLSISGLCFAAALAIVSPRELSVVWVDGNRALLALALALMPVAVYSRAWRWWYILRQKKINLPLTTVGRITFVGHAYNLFLPASLGDVVRSYYAWREVGAKEVMLASAVVDKVVALFSLCLLGVVCSLAVGSASLALAACAILCPIAVVLVVPRLVPWKWVIYVFEKIFRRPMLAEKLVDTFRLDLRTLVASVGISFFGWGVTNLMYFVSWRAFSPDISLWHAFAFAPLINIMRILPITVSGLGSADLLILFLGQSVGMQESDALMGSLAVNVSLIILPGVVGAVRLLTDVR